MVGSGVKGRKGSRAKVGSGVKGKKGSRANVRVRFREGWEKG